MPQPTTIDFLMYNSVSIPAAIGIFKRRSLERPFRIFVYFLLLGAVSEFLKTTPEQPLVYYRMVNNVYALVALPALCYSFLLWSNKNPSVKTGLFTLAILLLLLAEVYFLGLEHKKVSVVNIFGAATCIFLGVDAFVYQLAVPAQRNKIKAPLFFITPILVFYLYFVIIRLMMMKMYNPSTDVLFMDLWQYFQYINVASNLCFSFGFLWAPNKEKYLTLTGP